MAITLTKYASLQQTQDHIHIEFTELHKVLSSGVLNGGFASASHLLNIKVPKESTINEPPSLTLSNYCKHQGWKGTSVGMMTAASMKSLRIGKVTEQGIDIVVVVTSGLSNARRVGDYAEYRKMTEESSEVGTINIVVLTSATLTDAASVEAVLMITEAKVAALQEAEIMSPISNKMATGTGTDSVAVVSGKGPELINYCGKHVVFGEILGRLVKDTVTASIAWELNK